MKVKYKSPILEEVQEPFYEPQGVLRNVGICQCPCWCKCGRGILKTSSDKKEERYTIDF